jgi:penicillin-binding protein A
MLPFARESQRVMLAILIGFLVIAGAAFQWAVITPDSLNTRDDNPRAVERERRIVRGDIYALDGTVLASSGINSGGIVARQYPVPAAWPALGYYSMTRGSARIEAAFNDILSGTSQEALLANRLLHTPITGSDIRVTLDMRVQTVAATRMENVQGAAVALSIPDGRVMALGGGPMFDPNTLDANFESLRVDPSAPLINRAVERRYPPGTAIQPVLMIASLLTGQPLDVSDAEATTPLELNEAVSLGCAVRLPEMALSLRDAFAFACPSPFFEVGSVIGETALLSVFEQVNVINGTDIAGYDNNAPAVQIAGYIPTEGMAGMISGHGSLTVTPLAMAIMMGAVVNDGNTPLPWLLDATLAPDALSWLPAQRPTRSIALTTATTARRLQDLMRYNVVNGAAQNAGRPNIDIGGHVGLAYSGGQPLSWFIGFVTASGRQAGAVAIVLENTADTGLAADIGGDILASMHASLTQGAP